MVLFGIYCSLYLLLHQKQQIFKDLNRVAVNKSY